MRPLLTLLALVSVLALVACGDDDDSSEPAAKSDGGASTSPA